MKQDNEIKKIYGIDTLYYFCESSSNYDLFFMELMDKIESIKGVFAKKEIEYKNSDITISLEEIPLQFLNKAEGFYWFMDINEFFKLGFKDSYTNQGLHDIQVQLMGSGIYSIGIKTLLELIESLLKEITTSLRSITRMDVNCFIQYDFSFVDKSMFVTRKRRYANYGEIGDSKNTQTLYVGNKPFLLRLYNKTLEMQKSKKQEVMIEYFIHHGFDTQLPIFNVEFEMHRAHLKSFGITTLEDAITKSQMLFIQSMDEIRMIDTQTLSEKSIENNTKNRADTLPIWDAIKTECSMYHFLQHTMPLERIKKHLQRFDEDFFAKEFQTLIRKALISNIYLTPELLNSYLEQSIHALEVKHETKKKKQQGIRIEVKKMDGSKDSFRLLKNGNLVKHVNVFSVSKMSDFDLLSYLDDITADFQKEGVDFNETNKRYKVAYDEAVRRKLKPEIPF